MNKPEKQKLEDKGLIGQFGHWSYNKACDRWERYHTWDIKTNYIHKDRLHRVEIESEIAIGMNKWSKMSDKEQHENSSLIEYLATELSKELKNKNGNK